MLSCRWKTSENRRGDSEMHISFITALQRQYNLMLLVAISWTYSSSPCKQSAQHWSGRVLQAVTAHQQLGKDLVREKWADVREDSPAWQDQKIGAEKKRDRKATKEGEGSTMWVECHLCWYFVVAHGVMAEGPVITNMRDFKPNKQREFGLSKTDACECLVFPEWV